MHSDGINEQLGDPPEWARAEVIIKSAWADRLVAAITPPWADRDDLAQEARLEMWRVASYWDGIGSFEAYLRQKARWKVLAILTGNHRYTGEERTRAVTQRRGDESRQRLRSEIAAFKTEHHREPTTREMADRLGVTEQTVNKQKRKMHLTPTDVKAKIGSLDALIEAYGTEAVFEAVDIYDSVVLAYHYGEIHSAVADLDPIWREYIFLRFWQGQSEPETARILNTRVHWSRDVKPLLAERLVHLQGAS